MTTIQRERFAAIWRPVFGAEVPSELDVDRAWARTKALLSEQYGSGLTEQRCREMVGEMAIAWLLRALAPSASAADTEQASLAQQAALWLGAVPYDLARVYEGYYRLLQAWGAYR
jgi:hypothetical protein